MKFSNAQAVILQATGLCGYGPIRLKMVYTLLGCNVVCDAVRDDLSRSQHLCVEKKGPGNPQVAEVCSLMETLCLLGRVKRVHLIMLTICCCVSALKL